MRKRSPIFIIICLSIIGGYLAFTYEAPAFKIFHFNQQLDDEIVEYRLTIERSLEEMLSYLHGSVRDLIFVGQIYDGEKNLTAQFAFLEEDHAFLREYVETVLPRVNEIVEQADFEAMENSIAMLSEEAQPVALNMMTLQRERLDYLVALHDQLLELNEMLLQFEEVFHYDRPSVTIPFFQEIADLFVEIKEMQHQYVETTANYYEAKQRYFLLINTGFRAYFTGI